MKYWYNELRENNDEASAVIIGNKIDLIDDENYIERENVLSDFADLNLEYFETSAKTGEKIECAFDYLISECYNKKKNIYAFPDIPFAPDTNTAPFLPIFNFKINNPFQSFNFNLFKKPNQQERTRSTTESPTVENNNNEVCKSCQKNIDKNELIYYSGFEYHRNCLKCSVCQKKIEPDKNSEDFICLTPGMFICKNHYAEYQEIKELPENALNEYVEKVI